MKDNTLMAVIVIAMFTFFSVLAISEALKSPEKPCNQMHEYQLELEHDTVKIYQNGRYVDCYIVNDSLLSPLDQILGDDNR